MLLKIKRTCLQQTFKFKHLLCHHMQLQNFLQNGRTSGLELWKDYISSTPRILLASCMSRGYRVTLLAWMAQRLASDNNITRNASAAWGCRKRISIFGFVSHSWTHFALSDHPSCTKQAKHSYKDMSRSAGLGRTAWYDCDWRHQERWDLPFRVRVHNSTRSSIGMFTRSLIQREQGCGACARVGRGIYMSVSHHITDI